MVGARACRFARRANLFDFLARRFAHRPFGRENRVRAKLKFMKRFNADSTVPTSRQNKSLLFFRNM